MALGPGKYDWWCTQVREGTGAVGVVLIVFKGEESGFSVQVTNPALQGVLPELLEEMARQVRVDRAQAASDGHTH